MMPSSYLAIIALILLGFQLLRTWWRLKSIPGPFWAKITNFQRVFWVRTGRAHEIHMEMHEKYGDFVRFGPNMISIGDPAAIPTVYPMRPGFPKSNFYRTLMPYTKKGGALPAVFNTRDEKLHKQIKNPIGPFFSMSSVVTYEPFVNEVLEIMCKQLDERFVSSAQIFDLGEWLQFFAFDVMGTLTFSKRYGFLETGQDVKNVLATIWTYMKRAAPMTQIPWLDQLWNKNSWTTLLRSTTTGFSLLKIVGDFINDRRNSGEKDNHERQRDMLSRFMEVQKKDPSIPPWAVTAWTFSNVIAGSDSTGVVLRTAWFNLTAHPSTFHKLRAELVRNAVSRPYPKWSELQHLPYLDACVLEASRLHPPFCLPLERVVPAGGVTICGRYFPTGTVVGMSPWVANRHKPTFGEDAEQWRPERWLEVGEEQRKKMEQSIMTFGAGRRICLGKNLAVFEMKKLTATLVMNYDVDLIDPKSFVCENAWFFKQRGLNVRIMRHNEAPASIQRE